MINHISWESAMAKQKDHSNDTVDMINTVLHKGRKTPIDFSKYDLHVQNEPGGHTLFSALFSTKHFKMAADLLAHAQDHIITHYKPWDRAAGTERVCNFAKCGDTLQFIKRHNTLEMRTRGIHWEDRKAIVKITGLIQNHMSSGEFDIWAGIDQPAPAEPADVARLSNPLHLKSKTPFTKLYDPDAAHTLAYAHEIEEKRREEQEDLKNAERAAESTTPPLTQTLSAAKGATPNPATPTRPKSLRQSKKDNGQINFENILFREGHS